jgi:hypothetical protein
MDNPCMNYETPQTLLCGRRGRRGKIFDFAS